MEVERCFTHDHEDDEQSSETGVLNGFASQTVDEKEGENVAWE